MKTNNPFSLEDKTILVTGASSGIGQTTAIECSRMGAKVVITGRNEERLKETFNALIGEGHSMVLSDLSNEEEIARLVSSIQNIDGLVSNAGMSCGVKPMTFFKQSDYNNMFMVNTIASATLMRYLNKKKKINKNASCVFTSSVEGTYKTSIGNGLYGMTKAALSAFVKTSALELASKGIRCNTINPGMVKTPLIAPNGALTQEQLAVDENRYPLGRYGSTQDIAYAIIFLLSDASSWVTGTELKIDGGISLV